MPVAHARRMRKAAMLGEVIFVQALYQFERWVSASCGWVTHAYFLTRKSKQELDTFVEESGTS